MKVLHVLDHSLPIQSGYAFRSASILQGLRRLGVDVSVVTSPKHDSAEPCSLDGIDYQRSWGRPVRDGVRGQVDCVLQTRRALRHLVAESKPDVIHAHSPCLNGLAAARLGVPLVYEIRSSWEDAAVSSGKTREGSLRYRASAWLETRLARSADQVVVLCQGLLDEFAGRGIARERLTIVGNAIDRSGFRAPDPDRVETLRVQHGLSGKRVLGFFGSFFAWEGLDELIRALPYMLERNDRIELLLAGGGEEETSLQTLARGLGVHDRVHFLGRVPHEQMPDYYALADLMVFPRRAIRIAEMVTPLKPLEAMHFGCVVVASDVGGHRELIRHGETGVLFPAGDPRALAECVLETVAAPERCDDLRRKARDYLENERSWERMAERYLEVYARALSPKAGSERVVADRTTQG